MIECHHCHAETSNGITLCQACRIAVLTYLEFLPVYYANLARWCRPGRPNGSLGSAGQWMLRRGEADSGHLEPALTHATSTLTTWAEKLDLGLPDGDNEAAAFAALCELLEDNLARIATTDEAGQFVRDIARHERTLRNLTETLVPGWYAGTCQQPAGRDMEGNHHTCGANTYVVPGLTWVTCPRCGATTHASAHVDVVLAEAVDWIAPPMRLAEAVVVLVDTELSVDRLYERVRKWGRRGQLESLRELDEDGDQVGPHRYRLGDVLGRLQAEGTTRVVERSMHLRTDREDAPADPWNRSNQPKEKP